AGKLLDRTDPRALLIPGLALFGGALFWYASLMTPDTPVWMFLLPSAVMGLGSAGLWGPLATTATRNLPQRQAGAGSGIYNTPRTVGSVIGSAAIAAFMQSRTEANLPGAGESTAAFGAGQLPDVIVSPFSDAMAQTMLLPAAVMIAAIAIVAFMVRPKHLATKD